MSDQWGRSGVNLTNSLLSCFCVGKRTDQISNVPHSTEKGEEAGLKPEMDACVVEQPGSQFSRVGPLGERRSGSRWSALYTQAEEEGI